MKLSAEVRAAAVPALPAHADLLAGVVLRPPRPAWDGSRYRGPSLREADPGSLAGVPGVVRVVVERDFVGVVALDAAFAHGAAARLRIEWDEAAGAPHHERPADQAAAQDDAAQVRTYRWPAADSGAAGHTWAVAWHHGDGVTVWCSCSRDAAMRQELAALLALAPERVMVQPNGLPDSPLAFDAAADAALLSRAVGKPVKVDAHPQGDGTGDLLTIALRTSLGPDGRIAALALQPDRAHAARPSLARLLSHGHAGQGEAGVAALESYPFIHAPTLPQAVTPLAPAQADVREGLAAAVFATESAMDEMAQLANVDPVAFRLQHIADARGAALVRTVGEKAADPQRQRPAAKGVRRGTGFAYASARDEGTARTWSAWKVDVSVDSDGGVDIDRVVVGHDSEQLRPTAPDSVWIQGQVQDATSRLLEAPSFDAWNVPAAEDAGTRNTSVPSVEVVRPPDALAAPGRLAWSESAKLPAAAALANAIFDATGLRLREPPFSGAHVQARLSENRPGRSDKSTAAWLGGLGAVAAGLLVTVLPWRAGIAPTSGPDPSLYSAAAIERGRLVAAAGDCIVCHTAPGGRPNAGGLALDTPFGTIYSTNITPDVRTGIGGWSYSAFERAMREGIHRDGRRLYPAFPYTAFAKTSDADLQALYAYLMAQPAIEARPPETKLAFPFNVRPLMAGWNALFHDATPYQPDVTRSVAWNRGAYLVQGLGHCGACHTPRNPLGAERKDTFLAGGLAEGWEAPALTGLSKAPLPWTQADLYDYLRTGLSARHGVAAGPMAPVIQELGHLPDSDIRAMATYLGSLNPPAPDDARLRAQLHALESRAVHDDRLDGPGARIFEGACAACHQTPGGPTLFGAKVSLALTTGLHSDRPDNLVQVILQGIADPANGSLGYMPGFADSLDDRQVADLVRYLRLRFGGGKPQWEGVPQTIERARNLQAHQPR